VPQKDIRTPFERGGDDQKEKGLKREGDVSLSKKKGERGYGFLQIVSPSR